MYGEGRDLAAGEAGQDNHDENSPAAPAAEIGVDLDEGGDKYNVLPETALGRWDQLEPAMGMEDKHWL